MNTKKKMKEKANEFLCGGGFALGGGVRMEWNSALRSLPRSRTCYVVQLRKQISVRAAEAQGVISKGNAFCYEVTVEGRPN